MAIDFQDQTYASDFKGTKPDRNCTNKTGKIIKLNKHNTCII